MHQTREGGGKRKVGDWGTGNGKRVMGSLTFNGVIEVQADVGYLQDYTAGKTEKWSLYGF